MSTGLAVESAADGSGCAIVAIEPGSRMAKDGRLAVGDVLAAVNNESLCNITTPQAQAVLRRISLLGGTTLRCVAAVLE